MKIKLKSSYIEIEVPKNSKYLDFIYSNLPSKNTPQNKKEEFLKTLYYICVKNVQYQNPNFLKKLLKASSKQIKVDIIEPLKKHYLILNVNENDSLHVIRKRYLKLAKIYHPDKVTCTNKNLVKEYTTKFQKIQKAYEVLKYKIAS
ncbi:J domain-containing protein [Sulfurospirillum arcachonense]|uniref:J domain-containing protein n=1 Tax=Sulfurospirillum arcachonense TaxID=57666 RepID=UPI000469889C|nr:J domain-containing protein [Sulfurospirillum arcachonense]